jgi:hypothetical protein
MPDKPFATGQCLCGAVRITINAEPVGMGQCHCKDCQRASGTGHSCVARFKKDDVSIVGQTNSYASMAESGNINTRYFCPKCGSRVFGENSARPGLLTIPVGCIDDNSWFIPNVIAYVKDRPPWDITSKDVPNFKRMPPPVR